MNAFCDRLATHPHVVSPVTLGGLDPVVLMPEDWTSWTEDHQRAVLLHELSHLARRDDWAKLLGEPVHIPLFLHPLVSWPLALLDRERELLCDEVVVALLENRATYARLLLELVSRLDERFIQVAPFSLDARQAPAGTRLSVNLTEGEVKADVIFVLLSAP
jgi:beta-lactamase regulating signal transducer with metallopeptidase domain